MICQDNPNLRKDGHISLDHMNWSVASVSEHIFADMRSLTSAIVTRVHNRENKDNPLTHPGYISSLSGQKRDIVTCAKRDGHTPSFQVHRRDSFV